MQYGTQTWQRDSAYSMLYAVLHFVLV